MFQCTQKLHKPNQKEKLTETDRHTHIHKYRDCIEDL